MERQETEVKDYNVQVVGLNELSSLSYALKKSFGLHLFCTLFGLSFLPFDMNEIPRTLEILLVCRRVTCQELSALLALHQYYLD